MSIIASPHIALAAAFALAGTAAAGPALAQSKTVPETRTEITLSFAPVVKRVAPAVVNVHASRQVQRNDSPLFDDPFFRRFFGIPGGATPPQRMQRSLGSGVIIDPSGIIITNHHVIKGADKVRVALADKREFECDVILDDDRTDLAVLRIRKPDGRFPFLEFADSDKLEVGDLVLAIGNPFGVGQTVTQGIVSALARTRVGVTDYQFFIQTDAAINPGNSGGALIDVHGRLVGINTAIYSRSGGSNGIGFAIPANMVHVVADSAKTGKTVKRPWLGARLQAVTADIANSLGLKQPSGALVVRIFPDSPAASAGLKEGDLILSVAGKQVTDPNSFGYHFATRGVEGTTEIEFLRGGRRIKVDVELKTAPLTVALDKRYIDTYSPFDGVTVVNLSPAVVDRLRLRGLDTDKGVVIVKVEPNSLAGNFGLRAGDVVVSINNRRIETTRQLATFARQTLPLWLVRINRRGRVLNLRIRG